MSDLHIIPAFDRGYGEGPENTWQHMLLHFNKRGMLVFASYYRNKKEAQRARNKYRQRKSRGAPSNLLCKIALNEFVKDRKMLSHFSHSDITKKTR